MPLDHSQVLGLLIGFVVVNFATFCAFGWDKARARRQQRRISESTLLWLVFAGGSPAAYAGRRTFRHKTKKQPFVSQLHSIAAIQCAAIAAGLYYWFFV